MQKHQIVMTKVIVISEDLKCDRWFDASLNGMPNWFAFYYKFVKPINIDTSEFTFDFDVEIKQVILCYSRIFLQLVSVRVGGWL